MEIFEDRQAGVVVVTLDYGEDLLPCLREVARKADIHTGIVYGGIGTFSEGHIHTVVTNDLPPQEEYLHLEGPLEVVTFTGIIAGYEPHVHVNLMTKDLRYVGGHLEDGCPVLAVAEVAIHRLPTLRLERRVGMDRTQPYMREVK